jgi:PTS system nitrogen regulatory IIA component
MPLADLLIAERIVMLVEPGNRDSVLDAAARLLSNASPALTPVIGEALREREQLGSTAIGCGVAIPHGRSKAFEQTHGAFLRLRYPVDFGASDNVPIDLVFAMGVPEHSTQAHLQVLAELADRFSDGDFRDALRGARDLPALRGILLGLPRATMTMQVRALP